MFEHGCYQSSPTRLMASPKAFSVIAMEVFVEQDKILPVGFFGIPRFFSVTGALALRVALEQSD
jgi:hypothetical protein